MFRWKTASATRIRTRKRTSKVTLMLILTLSSCLCRESLSFTAGRASIARNGLGRNQLVHLTAADANGRNIYPEVSNKLGDRMTLSLSAFPRGILCSIRNPSNQNWCRNYKSIHYGYLRDEDCSSTRTFTRNLSINAKAPEDEEYSYQGEHSTEENDSNNENKTSDSFDVIKASSESRSIPSTDDVFATEAETGRESFVNILSIDPEYVEIYERGDQEDLALAENRKDNIIGNSNPFLNRNFIDMFRGSANYIASHRDKLAVFHLPGDLMDENPVGFRDLMNDISLSWLLGMKIVIVAGCQYQIKKRHKKDNIDRQEHLGMVVTDHESLRIVKEEAGYVRFEVERQLARALKSGSSSGNRMIGVGNGNARDGSNHFGGNVVSGNFYSAQPFGVLDGVDFRYSGFVRRMEVDKIHQVLQNRDIVLLTPLGFSPTGEVFNVNSEYLAAHVAGELGASKIVYFLEKDAALRHKIHGSDIPHLRINDGRNLLDLYGVRTKTKGFVCTNGCPFALAQQMFLVKMGWGLNALMAGVKRVHLISPYDGALLQELYTRDGSGTMISGDLYDGIQSATVDDVTAIFEVISPLVQKGTLVERTKAELERDIDQYHVYTRDGLLIACGQLKMFEDGFAEFGCLVVNPLYRAKGRGDAMLGYLERLCVQNGASNLFVLSTQTMEWFVERGFVEVGVERLPPSRQATYNHERASKIYLKRITSLRDLDASELFWDR